MVELFEKIEASNEVPYKWKTSRMIPLFKKGDRTRPENYRPISNLCSLAKVFEKCILDYMQEAALLNNINLTNKRQYGFKRGHSTVHLALHLQQIIANALDAGKFAGIVSLDLSSAFDIIPHELLFKRLALSGLNHRTTDIIIAWLSNRNAYIESGLNTSTYFDIKSGSIQGSVLGPILFSLFIDPIFDILEEMLAFADDSYIYHVSEDITEVTSNLESKANTVVKWLENSGMIVNKTKTDAIIFGRNVNQSKLMVAGEEVTIKDSIKILGIEFDSSLSWSKQIDKTISNAKKSTHSLNHLRKYFSQDEMLKIATVMTYSKFYYGSQVWLGPMLPKQYIHRLKSASTWIIKSALG